MIPAIPSPLSMGAIYLGTAALALVLCVVVDRFERRLQRAKVRLRQDRSSVRRETVFRAER